MTAARQHSSQSGFALLLVFLLAAFIGISLYVEMPRVVFEGQRAKEQTLIDRGEQYRRAIQLYFRKFKTYPPNMEALENTNRLRFLRRKYKDPMTGKDEWRLIHAGPGGTLTDSKVQQRAGKEEKGPQNTNTFITEGPAVGSTGATGSGLPAILARRRPSDSGPPAPGGTPSGQPGEAESQPQPVSPQPALPPGLTAPQPGTEAEGENEPVEQVQEEQAQETGEQPQPAAAPAFGGAVPPGQMQPGQMQPGQMQPGQVPPVQPQPGQVQPGQPQPVPFAMPNVPGRPSFPMQQPQPVPGAPAPYTQPYIGSPGVVSPAPQPQQPPAGAPFPQQPGSPQVFPPGGQNPAADMINRLLRTPSPRGLAGQGGVAGGSIGGGIAGVASKYEGEGIKVYNDRKKYEEWEFLYDFSRDRANGGLAGLTGAANQQGIQSNRPGAFGPQPSPGPFPPPGPRPPAR